MTTQSMSDESKQHIEQLADEALEQLEGIAAAAKSKLTDGRTLGSDALASINTMTSSSAIKNLGQISQANRESFQVLAAEPAIARVVVADGDGQERTYYICRTTPVSGFPNLSSYRAPIGRLASLEIGTEFTLPNGTVVEVLERAQLRPTALADGWDSRDTVVEAEHFGPLTIESLRALLTEVADEEDTEDLLGQLLAEETVKTNIIDGVRRRVIIKMGLRDQPVLDQYQDEIFRLPLNKRLLILGPPGTGKTTTLIRRLGQKLDAAFLEEDEQRLVEMVAAMQGGVEHANSWLMFTPTELLKQYLKEAFAREGVPASDMRIRTWQDYRRELARYTFGVLRTASGGGTYVLKDGLPSLRAEALDSPIKWFDDFDTWQRNIYVQELHEAATMLLEAKSPEVQSLGENLQKILAKTGEGTLASMFGSLAAALTKVKDLVTSLKDGSDAKIKAALNLQLNRNRAFLDELARFVDGLQQTQSTDTDEQDDFDADEDEDATAPRTGRAAALKAYMQAVRAHARAAASKRTVTKTSRNGKILEWLGERTLTEEDRAEVGSSLFVQTNARRFVNPVKRYLDGIPKRYRAFRRERQQEGQWYSNVSYDVRDIHPLELDVVLLAILRAASDLISRRDIQRDINSPAWSSLKPLFGYYRNQVLVDEATDFSPIQLACMAALAHPSLRSFFACGDFNQRLTTWGARTAGELKWVFADFDIREINISYRQSKQLNELARSMIYAVGGVEQDVTLPEHVDSEGVKPALLEHAAETSVVIRWLADRVLEIERFVGQLPSTAIFVNSEDDVPRLAGELNDALAEHNVQVIACHEGQSVGHESNVRVFDVQHIKGLEFEAVFFVGIDKLAAQQPELFDKYLYVGTTRAATYLGVTCEKTLPETIEALRPLFAPDWRQSE